jgi:hypothetical protein
LAGSDSLGRVFSSTIASLEAAKAAYSRAYAYFDSKTQVQQRGQAKITSQLRDIDALCKDFEEREKELAKANRLHDELKAATLAVRGRYEASLRTIAQLEAQVALLQRRVLQLEEAAARPVATAAEAAICSPVPDGGAAAAAAAIDEDTKSGNDVSSTSSSSSSADDEQPEAGDVIAPVLDAAAGAP